MIPFIEDAKDAILAALNDAKGSFDTWKVPWTQARAEKLDSLDKTISSRASAADYTPTRAAKLDHLDRVGTATDTDTTASLFGKLAEIKKISAERRTQIAATLGLMDIGGLSGDNTAKELADALDGVPIIGAVNQVLTTTGETYTVPRGYHNGSGAVVTNIANLVPENVKDGVNIGGVVGAYFGRIKMISGTASANTNVVIRDVNTNSWIIFVEYPYDGLYYLSADDPTIPTDIWSGEDVTDFANIKYVSKTNTSITFRCSSTARSYIFICVKN